MLISLAALAVIVVASVAWVGIRAWLAKGELEAAIPLAGTVQSQLASGDTAGAAASAKTLQAHAAEAASLTGDVVWRAMEIVPFAGPNLTAFREAAAVTDSVASDAIWPLANDVAGFGIESFQPVDGRIDLAPITSVQQSVQLASNTLRLAATRAHAIDTTSTLQPITDAVTKLTSSVDDADRLIAGIDNAVQLLPRMLGADGPRNYLLVFQNPAEARAGGGITSALALVSTDAGAVSLSRQESAGNFPVFDPPAVQLSDEIRGLYTDRPAMYVQNTTLIPEFSLSGQIASSMWTSQFGGTVDGVMSFDPVALSYLLAATGPVTLPTGEDLTSENAVPFLLSDVYAKYPDPAVQDAVFAAAAKAVFDRISSGGMDSKALLSALVTAGNEGRLHLWSSHEEDQQILAGTTLAGGLPAVTEDSTGIGVYFNDATGAKMDYYLDTAVSTAAEVCRADGRPAIRVSVTLTNTLAPDAVGGLPAYVTGDGAFGVTPGNISTLAYVYGPASVGTLTDSTVITALDPGAEGAPSRSSYDGDHIVAVFPVDLAPGESRTVTVDFLAQAGNPLTINPQVTPMINATVYEAVINSGFSGC